MPQSLSHILVHLIFSTKERQRLIQPAVEEEVRRYLTTICATCGCPAHKIGGTEDHIHILFSLSRTMTVAKLVEIVKKDSSKWMKKKGQEYRFFSWQNGYGAFSIGQSQMDIGKRYIANQKEHHKAQSFQDEFRAFLGRYRVEYDERYVWD